MNARQEKELRQYLEAAIGSHGYTIDTIIGPDEGPELLTWIYHTAWIDAIENVQKALSEILHDDSWLYYLEGSNPPEAKRSLKANLELMRNESENDKCQMVRAFLQYQVKVWQRRHHYGKDAKDN